MKVNGFILAGGKSERMHQDKALLDWHGRTLLEHMVDLLSSAADQVQVAGRNLLPDRLPGRGPLSGIATALEASNTEANLVIAVDLPLLTREFLKYLRSQTEKSSCDVLAYRIGSDFALCLGLRRRLLPEVQRRLAANELSVHGLIEHSDPEFLEWPDPSIFQNINTLKDYYENLGKEGK